MGLPAAYFLTSFSVGLNLTASGGLVFFALAGLVLPAAALVLGVKALRDMADNARVGGRSLAMTGMVTGIAGSLWCLTMIGIAVVRLMSD